MAWILFRLLWCSHTSGALTFIVHILLKSCGVFICVFYKSRSCLQGSPIEWVSTHRYHHQYTDTKKDPHSPIKGLWFSHIGWIFNHRLRFQSVSAWLKFSISWIRLISVLLLACKLIEWHCAVWRTTEECWWFEKAGLLQVYPSYLPPASSCSWSSVLYFRRTTPFSLGNGITFFLSWKLNSLIAACSYSIRTKYRAIPLEHNHLLKIVIRGWESACEH